MGFVDAVKSGFANAFKFDGRARRPEYWWFFLFVFAGAFVVGLIDAALFGTGGGMRRPVLVTVFQLIIFVPFLTVGWRRLHDTGRPGWYLLVPAGLTIITSILVGSATQAMMGLGMGMGQMNGAASGAMAMGAGVVILLSLVQVIAGIVIIWWMSRPSQHGTNAYGPEPRKR
ncbi:DUF805 domain-containing protein [Roseicitreum antarcticum]|uniref:Uncharacterized membrane protein YhaH, DUF805 family n=1 Tax=Roseicitreum antarcticum TaxID=564137 RepID=A0A1H2XEE4_9RHOB|nr:DUF805 domain-containing protein [Roseicitreum antarcticum]SDW91210.1 Uncharacterized membrane protein YhaH, DUF805 family [Roseicitreum antarcticum]